MHSVFVCTFKRNIILISYMYVLVSSEESSAVPGVGVEKLVETKRLDFLKDGPLFWVDSADSQPCMGETDT